MYLIILLHLETFVWKLCIHFGTRFGNFDFRNTGTRWMNVTILLMFFKLFAHIL